MNLSQSASVIFQDMSSWPVVVSDVHIMSNPLEQEGFRAILSWPGRRRGKFHFNLAAGRTICLALCHNLTLIRWTLTTPRPCSDKPAFVWHTCMRFVLLPPPPCACCASGNPFSCTEGAEITSQVRRKTGHQSWALSPGGVLIWREQLESCKPLICSLHSVHKAAA